LVCMYADLLSCNMDCGIKYVWTVAGSLHYSFILSAGLVVILLDKHSESTICSSSVFILSTEDNTARSFYLDHRMDGPYCMLPARKDMTEFFIFLSRPVLVWSRSQR